MKHKHYIFILIGISIFCWYKVLFTTFISEGAMYFPLGYFNQEVKLGYDQGARLFFEIFKVVFQDNVLFYNIFLLFVIVSLGVLFYFLVYKATDNKLIAFTSSIIFNINYSTLFEFYGNGWYNRFIERPVWFLLLFPSFYFFVDYFKSRNKRSLISSLIFYMVGLYLGEYNIVFLPMYVVYVIALYVGKTHGRKIQFTKNNVKDLLTLLPFALYSGILFLLNVHFLSNVDTISSTMLFSLLPMYIALPLPDIPDLVLRQLVIITIPSHILIQIIAKNMHMTFDEGIKQLYLPVTIVYMVAFFYVYLKEKKYHAILLSSIVYLFIGLVLNVAIRSDIVRMYQEGSRYLFIPSIGFSIFWGIILYTVFKKWFLKPLLLIIIIVWVAMNGNLIYERSEYLSPNFQAISASLAYVKSVALILQNDSIVILPTIVGDMGSTMAQIFYGKETMFFAPYNFAWDRWIETKIKRPIDPKKDIILRYDFKREQVVDETANFKEIIEKKRKGTDDPKW